MREKSRAEIRIAEEFPFMCRDNPKASSRHAGNGFEFHEGWESIIRGWCLDVVRLYQDYNLEVDIAPICFKDKFGVLEFHYDIENEELWPQLKKINKKWGQVSSYTCEECGHAGFLRQTTMSTLCDSCFERQLFNIKYHYDINYNISVLRKEIADTIEGEYAAITDEYDEIADFAFDNITMPEGNYRFTGENGVLYNIDKTILLKYSAKKPDESFEIPDSVLVIGVAAFANCKNLKSIKIPESVIIISNNAFAGCTFEKLELPGNLRLIGCRAFEGCEFLQELRLPLSVTHLGFEATASCKAPVRCGAVPLTVENVLKQRVTTVEKNVYGFIRSLLLFSDLNDIKPIDVINKMGDKYIISIYYLGWGDINYQRRDNCMSDWHHIVFNESARYDVKETEDNAAREKAHVICNKIFEIKESTDKKYSEIIKEYFSEDNC